MALSDRETALRALRAVCAHPGDVLRCTRDYLSRHHYHLATREKNRLVCLLEAYPVPSFRENLMPSLQVRERNLVILGHLDYNRFSKSPAHREAVRALRSGELLSWHGIGESMLRTGDPGVLPFLAQRPGYMLRILNRLLSFGYPEADILKALLPQAERISGHLIVQVLRMLTRRKSVVEEAYRQAAELEALNRMHHEEIRKSEYDDQSTAILKALLTEHFRHAETPLQEKKVFLYLDQFDLDHSELETQDRSKDGGYLRSGICYRIPPEAKYVRFFVYWNDAHRVDLDLHAMGTMNDGSPLHVGWNAGFRKSGVVHSGDITHSDAAEYIDIDLSAPIREIGANIDLFSGRNAFGEVQTCYVGLMAVSGARQEVKHYDPKNCFFTHRLTQKSTWIHYGLIDVQHRYIRFIGQTDHSPLLNASALSFGRSLFSLKEYLDAVLSAQHVQIVSAPEEAELILTMEKSAEEKAISLIDHNFFLEC